MLAEIKSSLALKKNKSEEAFRKIQSTGHTSLPGLFKKKKKKADTIQKPRTDRHLH